MIHRLKETPAGWAFDPAGEEFDELGRSAALVRLKHRTSGAILAVPVAALPPATTKKEKPSAVQGKDGQ